MTSVTLDADAVKNGMQNYYSKLQGMNKPQNMSDNEFTQWKAEQFAARTNDTYKLINKNATMNTAEQMLNGANNPAKGQGLNQEQPSHMAITDEMVEKNPSLKSLQKK